jgi:hypothetical protein
MPAVQTLPASAKYAKHKLNGSDSHINLNNYEGFSSLNLAWKLVTLIALGA